MIQLTFGDAEDLGQRKQARRELFLAEMEQVVPWPALLAHPLSNRQITAEAAGDDAFMP